MNLSKVLNFLYKLPSGLNKIYKKKKVKIRIHNKSRNKNKYDPVTNMDKVFEKFIRKEIYKNFPSTSVSGEEFKDHISKSNYKWYVDPIDGTKAFILGAPTWSNLVALTYNKLSVFGLANFPELKKYYINDLKYSYVIKNKKKTKIKSTNITNLKKIKIIVNFHGTLKYEQQIKIIKKFGWSLRLIGFDALNYCLLAEGKVDAVIEANLKPYDIVPLIPILKKSGGQISTWDNKSAEIGGNILATSNKKLHKQILNILKKI